MNNDRCGIIAIDPGSRCAGITLSVDNERGPRWLGAISAQARHKKAKSKNAQYRALVEELQRIRVEFLSYIGQMQVGGFLIVVESAPYYHGSERARVLDLIQLSMFAGTIMGWAAGLISAYDRPLHILTPTPSAWKGQQDKYQHHVATMRLCGMQFTSLNGTKVIPLAHALPNPLEIPNDDWADVLDSLALARWASTRLVRTTNGSCVALLVESGVMPLRWQPQPELLS